MKSFKTPLLSLFVLLILGGCFDPSVVRYTCENGERIRVKYTIPQDRNEDAAAILYYNHEKIPMRMVASALGVRYVAFDEQNGYRWHLKGDTGILSFLEADHTAVEEVILQDCNP